MDDAVQQIKDRLNIVDIVGQYVQLRRAGKSYSARCPFHKERTPSFHVSAERGTYMCFGCGEKGDIFTFVEKMDGIDFKTALRQLAERAGVTLEARQFKAASPQEKEKEERLREVVEAAVKYFEGELRTRSDVQDYLHNRGVSDETAATWRLGYAPASWDKLTSHLKSIGFANDEIVDAGFGIKSDPPAGGAARLFDRFRGRIIFPIFDLAGQPIAVSGRFFESVPGAKQDGEPAKYVNSPETPLFRKSRVLYGLDRARAAIRKLDCILLVEGQFDLILAHQSGLPFTVALSGTALTPEHLSMLSRLSKRLVLALDADEAGVRAGLKSARLAIVAGFDVKVPSFPQGKDPADVAKENPELLKAAVRTSTTAVEFFLGALRPMARDERAYKQLVEAQVMPLVSALASRIEQEHFVALIAGRLGVSDMAVRASVEAAGRHEPEDAGNSPELHQPDAQSALSPLEKKAGMLLCYFPSDSVWVRRLSDAWGEPRVNELRALLSPQAEEMRFRFEAQLHEHTTEEAIAADMLADIERAAEKERFKMKFL